MGYPVPSEVSSKLFATYAPWERVVLAPVSTAILQELPEWQDQTIDEIIQPGVLVGRANAPLPPLAEVPSPAAHPGLPGDQHQPGAAAHRGRNRHPQPDANCNPVLLLAHAHLHAYPQYYRNFERAGLPCRPPRAPHPLARSRPHRRWTLTPTFINFTHTDAHPDPQPYPDRNRGGWTNPDQHAHPIHNADPHADLYANPHIF